MKRLIIVGLAALATALPAFPQGTLPVITLQQSIDATLANGDDNKILQGNLDISRAQHALNVSRNSLSLAGSAGYAGNWGFGNPAMVTSMASPLSAAAGPTAGVTMSGPLTSISVGVSPYMPPLSGALPAPGSTDSAAAVGMSVTQTLWNGYPGGPTQATVDKSVLTLQGRELATQSGRLALVYSVKQAYYTLLAAQRNLDVRKQIFEKQDSVLKQINAIYQLKLASLADLKTAQVNALTAQADVDSAANDLRFARIGLATFMGRPADEEFTAADAPDPSVPVSTVEEAVGRGLRQRVEIKQVELNVKSSGIDLALARGQATPSVSVSGGVNLVYDWSQGVAAGIAGLGTAGAGIAGAGVKLSMPILDAGAVRNQVTAILRQNDVYAAQETQLQKGIATAIRSAWQNVLLARERVDVAKLGVEATDLQYQIVSTQRDAGTASNQDLLTAAVNLANAENALQGAQSTAQLAVLLLQSVMGD